MRYFAFAVDFDGTLAHDGEVRAETLDALARVRATGRRIILVTGRRLPDLKALLSEKLGAFDRVVFENGAAVYDPATGAVRLLGSPPPPALAHRLAALGVPFEAGEVILATWEPHQHALLAAVEELGLEYWVSFNKGAVMLLPSGTNKATGLRAALRELDLSPRNCVGIGDAENDHSLLAACELGVAVGNAVPSLRNAADVALEKDHGLAVEVVARQLVEDDLASWASRVSRTLLLGECSGEPVTLPVHGPVLLVVGPSGSGKSSYARGLVEEQLALGFQVLVVDPEGDYVPPLPGTLTIGSATSPPDIAAVRPVLREPIESVVVNMLAVSAPGRAVFLGELLGAVREERVRSGRPHWVVIDESHHMLYPGGMLEAQPGGLGLASAALITLRPEDLSERVLREVTHVVALSGSGEEIDRMAAALGLPAPACTDGTAPGPRLWCVGEPRCFVIDPSGVFRPHVRHARKYAEGNLGPARSFYFRKPSGETVAAAANVLEFARLLGEIDASTWSFHLERGDFARWFRDCLSDEVLARAAERLAADGDSHAARERLQQLILDRYSAG